MARISLRVLGPPTLRSNDVEVHLASQKALGLLYFLATQPGQACSRSRLVTQLWEESAEREGRNSLSVALSRLRQSLPTLPIVAEGDTLTWVADDDVWVDAAAFRSLTAEPARIDDLTAAVELVRGPFLDGFVVRDSGSYEEWLQVEREAWQARLLTTLGRLIEHHEAAARWAPALSYARRTVAIDPLQEPGHRTLMRLLARSGDRAAAIGQYRACQELLAAELGTEPDPATTALYEAIVRGQLSQPSPPPTVAPARPLLPPVRLSPAVLPMIGRTTELALVRRHLEQAQQARLGRLIVLQGEAGIGKSRLIEELLRTVGEATTTHWNVLIGHAYEAERSLPYRPFIDALSAILPALDVSSLGLADLWLAEVARLLPEIASRPLVNPPATQLDPTQQRHRLFEGVARLLAALGAPLVFVLEDAHWADEGTLQLLAFILRHELLGGFPVIATVRSEDVGDELAGLLRSLEREGRSVTVRLERLQADSITILLRQMVTNGVEHLGERLYAETEGNPLFAVEMIRSLIEQGALRMGAEGELNRLVLPDSVQAVITSRLTRLDEADRTFLNAAAIFRRGAAFEHIAAVGGLDEGRALDVLEKLLQAQLLRETIDGTRGAVTTELYIFGHDKIRQVVYDGLSSARRRVLHRRAVEVLAADRAPSEELAYHAYLGHLWEQGLAWSEAAAGEARQVLGYAAATRLYRQALDCLANLPVTPEQRRREISLRLQLAQTGFYVQPGQLIDWLAPAQAAALELGDDQLLTQIRLAQASALYIQGRFAQAMPMLEQLIAEPTIAASAELQARSHNMLGRLLVLRGELRRAETTLRPILPLLEGRVSSLDLLITTDMLAAAIAYQGRFDEAMELAMTMLAQAEHSGEAVQRGVAHAFVELIAQTRGDWVTAIHHGRLAIAHSRTSANSIYEYVGNVFLSLALARQGDLTEALAVGRQTLALAERAQIKVLLGRAYGWMGELLLLAGELDRARTMVELGQAISHEHGYMLEGAICGRILAALHLTAGDLAAAEAALRPSLVVLEELGALPELGRAEAVLAHLRLAQGQHQAAQQAAQRANERFASMNMLADQALVAALV